MEELHEKQTILIVDDSPENITVLGALLRLDYTVRVATNGKKALKIVESDNPPDLILLDVMMPGMDGYEVCRRLKADSRTRNIPVIFITARCGEEDEVKGFETGAVDYVTKPFSPVVIKARVRTHVELKRYRDFLVNTSYCDGLTAIANRRRFDEYYATMWDLSVRESLPLSLILIDIDNFKLFNDNYGHQEGDACLIRIAQKLSASAKRKTDLVARYGGEEFVCVLPNTGLDGAVVVAEEFRAGILSLQIPHAYSSTGSYVTVSQG
ncbi:MAG: diguanylate cyclase, partial [Firmicutes bacterium]|nr:diguanylate cyclase [Bacillota bacterium]